MRDLCGGMLLEAEANYRPTRGLLQTTTIPILRDACEDGVYHAARYAARTRVDRLHQPSLYTGFRLNWLTTDWYVPVVGIE